MIPFNCYRLFLTPISPIHIGTGNSYEPTNYVIENGQLYEFDTVTAMSALPHEDRVELTRIIEGRPGAGMIRAMQRFFYERRSRLLSSAVNRVLVTDGVEQLYTARIGKTAQRDGTANRNVLEIARTVYNPISHEPIIVGSSLKGAIRTALLDQVNNGRLTSERDGLHRFQGHRDLFRYNQNRLELYRDPMRLVHVSDASWQSDATSPSAEVFFAANLKKIPLTDEQGRRRTTRADAGPPQILECLPQFRYRALSAQVTIQLTQNIEQAGSLPDADLRFDMRRIAGACNAFYRPILEDEMRYLAVSGYLEKAWSDAVKNILEDSRLKSGDAFLVRIGRHSGAESVTLRGVRKIRIMKGRSQPAQEGTSATTVWLAARQAGQTTGLMPFGWSLVEFCSLEQAAADENTALKTLCDVSERDNRAKLQRSPERQPMGQKRSSTRSGQPVGRGRSAELQTTTQSPTTPARQPANFANMDEIWEKATLTWNAGGGGVVTVIAPGQKRAELCAKAAQDFLATLTDQQRRQLDRRKELKNVRVVVEITGNQRTLKRLEE